MSELSRSVQAGTSQVAGAYQGLATLKAAGADRARRVGADLGASLGELGATLKEYGSWRDAKRAEDEERQVEDAYVLGMQTGDPSKALVTLGAVRPTMASAATLRSRRLAESMKAVYDGNAAKLGAARAFEETRKLDERDKAQKSAADAARKSPLKNPFLNEYVQSENADPELVNQYIGYEMRDANERLKEESRLKLQAEKDAANMNRVNARGAFVAEQGRLKREADAKEFEAGKVLDERGLAIRERANDIASRAADTRADAETRARVMDEWDAGFRGFALKVAMNLKHDDAARRAANDELETYIKATKTLAGWYTSQSWLEKDDEEREALASKAKGLLSDLENERKLMLKYAPPGFQWDPPAAPDIPTGGAGDTADAPSEKVDDATLLERLRKKGLVGDAPK